LDFEIQDLVDRYEEKWNEAKKTLTSDMWEKKCKKIISREDAESLNYWCFGDNAFSINNNHSNDTIAQKIDQSNHPNYNNETYKLSVHFAFLWNARRKFAAVCRQFNNSIKFSYNVNFGVQYRFIIPTRYLGIIGLLPLVDFGINTEGNINYTSKQPYYRKFYLQQFNQKPMEEYFKLDTKSKVSFRSENSLSQSEEYSVLIPKLGICKIWLEGHISYKKSEEIEDWFDFQNVEKISVSPEHNMTDIFKLMSDFIHDLKTLKIDDDRDLVISQVKGMDHVKVSTCYYLSREQEFIFTKNFTNLVSSLRIERLCIYNHPNDNSLLLPDPNNRDVETAMNVIKSNTFLKSLAFMKWVFSGDVLKKILNVLFFQSEIVYIYIYVPEGQEHIIQRVYSEYSSSEYLKNRLRFYGDQLLMFQRQIE
jgi:hypothetical protein